MQIFGSEHFRNVYKPICSSSRSFLFVIPQYCLSFHSAHFLSFRSEAKESAFARVTTVYPFPKYPNACLAVAD
jgi:hypothetical protein